jgi:hypothetical protein
MKIHFILLVQFKYAILIINFNLQNVLWLIKGFIILFYCQSVPCALSVRLSACQTISTVEIEMKIIRIFNYQEIVRTAVGYFLPSRDSLYRLTQKDQTGTLLYHRYDEPRGYKSFQVCPVYMRNGIVIFFLV